MSFFCACLCPGNIQLIETVPRINPQMKVNAVTDPWMHLLTGTSVSYSLNRTIQSMDGLSFNPHCD